MGATSQISAVIFSAFPKCPTKAHLLAIGEPAPGAPPFPDNLDRKPARGKLISEQARERAGEGESAWKFSVSESPG